MDNREEITVEISTMFVESFLQHDVNKILLLSNELKFNNAAIENLLLSYHYSEAGRVSHVEIKRDSIFLHKSLSGCFVVEYNTYFAMACSDKGYSNKNKMIINFEINLLDKKMRLSGEEIWERMPDDL
jgi:hypothetical protein